MLCEWYLPFHSIAKAWYDFRPNCTTLSSITIINNLLQFKWYFNLFFYWHNIPVIQRKTLQGFPVCCYQGQVFGIISQLQVPSLPPSKYARASSPNCWAFFMSSSTGGKVDLEQSRGMKHSSADENHPPPPSPQPFVHGVISGMCIPALLLPKTKIRLLHPRPPKNPHPLPISCIKVYLEVQ